MMRPVFVSVPSRINRAEIITVRGSFARLHAGEQLTMTGAWVDHPKFGRQFEVHSCTMQTPTSLGGLQKYLASGVIKGVGPACAELLIKKFGTSILEVIEKEPEKLQRTRHWPETHEDDR